jgi:hypothetical protein
MPTSLPGEKNFSCAGSWDSTDQIADDVFELFIVPSGGGTPVRLNGPLVVDGDVKSEGLQFSPDGSRVLYHADQETHDVVELFSVPSAGTA